MAGRFLVTMFGALLLCGALFFVVICLWAAIVDLNNWRKKRKDERESREIAQRTPPKYRSPHHYQAPYQPRFCDEHERKKYEDSSWYCYVHQLAREAYDERRFYPCYHCKKEFGEIENRRQQIPPRYQSYACVMEFYEWYWLKCQDKFAQQGFLTEAEVRTNKNGFIDFCVPIWQERAAERRRAEEQRNLDRMRKEREEKWKEPAKPIW